MVGDNLLAVTDLTRALNMAEELNWRLQRNESSQLSERNSNPGPTDCESDPVSNLPNKWRNVKSPQFVQTYKTAIID